MRKISLLAIALLAVVSIACGGGGEAPSTEAPSTEASAPAPSASGSGTISGTITYAKAIQYPVRVGKDWTHFFIPVEAPQAYAVDGANVTLFARNLETLNQVKAELANNGSQEHFAICADFSKPEEVAQCAVFLASDEAAWITGQLIAVDGGLTCGLL